MRKRVPALLEGCTAGWPAQRAWTAESLLMEREGNSLWVSESRRRHSGNDEQQVGAALVKGTASRDEYLFLKAYGISYVVLSVYALLVLTDFCCFVVDKNETQSFSLLVLNYLLIFKMLSVTLKMFTGSRL